MIDRGEQRMKWTCQKLRGTELMWLILTRSSGPSFKNAAKYAKICMTKLAPSESEDRNWDKRMDFMLSMQYADRNLRVQI